MAAASGDDTELPHQVLQRFRRASGLKQWQVRDALIAKGLTYTTANVSGWETGKWDPPREAVDIMDSVMGAGGFLLAAYGYLAGNELGRRLTELERRVARLEGSNVIPLRPVIGRAATTGNPDEDPGPGDPTPSTGDAPIEPGPP